MLLQIGPAGMGRQLAAAGVVDAPEDGAAMLFTADPLVVAELLARQVRGSSSSSSSSNVVTSTSCHNSSHSMCCQSVRGAALHSDIGAADWRTARQQDRSLRQLCTLAAGQCLLYSAARMLRQLVVEYGVVQRSGLTRASCACCSACFAGRVCQDVGQAAAAGSAAYLRWELLLPKPCCAGSSCSSSGSSSLSTTPKIV
jgi:hypothetical protein